MKKQELYDELAELALKVVAVNEERKQKQREATRRHRKKVANVRKKK